MLKSKCIQRCLSFLMALIMTLSTIPASVFAANVSVSVDSITILGPDGFVSKDANNYVSIKTSGDGGIKDDKATNTFTISHSYGVSGTLSFDYAISNTRTFTIGGETKSASGSYSKLIGPSDTLTLKVTSKFAFMGSPGDAVVTLKNLKFTKAEAASNVTFEFDSSKGSVTVDSAAISSGETKELSFSNGAALVATPKSGTTFLGWVNKSSGLVYSTATSYTLKPTETMTVQAVFVTTASDTAWFSAGNGTYVFNNLNNACSYASSAAGKTVVLANNGTVSTGNYTIPAGVTLLIPKDNSYEVQTTRPAYATANEFSETPPAVSAYRTLTLADGANITVNGAISIGGTQRAGGNYAATPTGACGFIRMNSGSNITLNSGAKLYAWGFICGSGNVVAKSGATVYESFQVGGWRGGDETTTMNSSNTNGVFPMSQYYVQNIEVPLKLEAGASEMCVLSVNVSVIGVQALEVAFVGSADSMFTISSGYVVKDYIESEDRLKMEGHGDVSLTPISLSIKASIIGTINIESKKYDLPINGNITLHIAEGTITANQDVALLPSARVILDEGTKCILGEGVSMYVYDSDEWGGYCGSGNVNFLPALNAPGRTYTRTAADLKDVSILVNGEVDASKGYVYTTAGGANIYTTGMGKITTKAGTQTVTHQRKHGTEDVAISITPAKLKNADGSYLETASATDTTTYEYCEPHGVWYTGECEACASKVEYTISWDTNDDGTVDDTTTVEAGTMPTHADGSKAATAEYTYTFTGWSPAIAAAAGNVTYTAQFSENPKSYTVTWMVDGRHTKPRPTPMAQLLRRSLPLPRKVTPSPAGAPCLQPCPQMM